MSKKADKMDLVAVVMNQIGVERLNKRYWLVSYPMFIGDGMTTVTEKVTEAQLRRGMALFEDIVNKFKTGLAAPLIKKARSRGSRAPN